MFYFEGSMLMLVAVVSTAGVLALWLLPTILGCGALSIAYCLLPPGALELRVVERPGRRVRAV